MVLKGSFHDRQKSLESSVETVSALSVSKCNQVNWAANGAAFQRWGTGTHSNAEALPRTMFHFQHCSSSAEGCCFGCVVRDTRRMTQNVGSKYPALSRFLCTRTQQQLHRPNRRTQTGWISSIVNTHQVTELAKNSQHACGHLQIEE
jgi:hypothetical protein